MYSSAEDEVREWYAVFTPVKIDHWFCKLLDQDFGHVYLIKELNDYQWLVMQYRTNLMDPKILIKSKYPCIRSITGPDAKIVHVQVQPRDRPIGCLNWSNCTELAKSLLGIKSFWTWTPKQLYYGLIGDRYGRSRR